MKFKDFNVGHKSNNQLHAQLRLGRSKLNSHLHQIGLSITPACKCGQLESVKHFLLFLSLVSKISLFIYFCYFILTYPTDYTIWHWRFDIFDWQLDPLFKLRIYLSSILNCCVRWGFVFTLTGQWNEQNECTLWQCWQASMRAEVWSRFWSWVFIKLFHIK